MEPLLFPPPTLTYRFPPASAHTYRVAVTMEGFIPILGGNDGKAEVKLALLVKGWPTNTRAASASHELTEAGVLFNDAKIPLTLQNFTDFFPLTHLTVSPSGQVVTTDAKEKKLPVRLPGLDPKRLPEVTFLPVELPGKPVNKGFEWSFSRPFGEAEVKYTCVVTELSMNKAKVSVKISQGYAYDENDSMEPTTDPADAVRHVVTTMKGEGTVVFDTENGMVDNARMDNEAVSEVTELVSKQKTLRKLRSKVEVSRDGVAPVSDQATPSKPESPLWKRVQLLGRMVLARSKFALGLLRSVLTQAFGGLGEK